MSDLFTFDLPSDDDYRRMLNTHLYPCPESGWGWGARGYTGSVTVCDHCGAKSKSKDPGTLVFDDAPKYRCARCAFLLHLESGCALADLVRGR